MGAERRHGFALIFVVVTLAVMMILATVVLANTAGTRQRDRTQNAVTELLRFGFEIGTNLKKPSFVGDVGKNPSRLSHLVQRITTAQVNSCGQNYTGSDVNKWLGPYHLTPTVEDAYYQLMPGVVASDTLQRTPTTGGANPIISIVMRNVSLELAQDLATAFDGNNSGAGPNITFVPSGTSPITVQYNVSVVGC
jgi:hypothetical protein